MKIRSKEIDDKEIFINVNDLIIEIMLEVDKAASDTEKKVYRNIVTRLTEIRDRSHKNGVK